MMNEDKNAGKYSYFSPFYDISKSILCSSLKKVKTIKYFDEIVQIYI